jgi:hypothetical protein
MLRILTESETAALNESESNRPDGSNKWLIVESCEPKRTLQHHRNPFEHWAKTISDCDLKMHDYL